MISIHSAAPPPHSLFQPRPPSALPSNTYIPHTAGSSPVSEPDLPPSSSTNKQQLASLRSSRSGVFFRLDVVMPALTEPGIKVEISPVSMTVFHPQNAAFGDAESRRSWTTGGVTGEGKRGGRTGGRVDRNNNQGGGGRRSKQKWGRISQRNSREDTPSAGHCGSDPYLSNRLTFYLAPALTSSI